MNTTPFLESQVQILAVRAAVLLEVYHVDCLFAGEYTVAFRHLYRDYKIYITIECTPTENSHCQEEPAEEAYGGNHS